MGIKTAAACALLACAAGTAGAVTFKSSTFDAGTEGWTALNGVDDAGVLQLAAGGDPGGFITATDGAPRRTWVWAAPESWAGDWSSAAGMTLGYSLMVTTAAGDTEDQPDVKLIGANGLELVIDAGPRPATSWTRYGVLLAPGAWRVGTLDGALATSLDFASVLGNLSGLRIRGEYAQLVKDTGSLDSVTVATTVPEPGTAVLWLAGGALMLWLGRRRR